MERTNATFWLLPKAIFALSITIARYSHSKCAWPWPLALLGSTVCFPVTFCGIRIDGRTDVSAIAQRRLIPSERCRNWMTAKCWSIIPANAGTVYLAYSLSKSARLDYSQGLVSPCLCVCLCVTIVRTGQTLAKIKNDFLTFAIDCCNWENCTPWPWPTCWR